MMGDRGLDLSHDRDI